MDINKRIIEAVAAAQDSFWAEIVKHFPEIPSGEFPPEAAHAFDQACQIAASTWVATNTPPMPIVIFSRFANQSTCTASFRLRLRTVADKVMSGGRLYRGYEICEDENSALLNDFEIEFIELSVNEGEMHSSCTEPDENGMFCKFILDESGTLAHRIVSLHENPGDKFQLSFECWAEDADHACEQAENAYPGCVMALLHNSVEV